jgi:hypothetical protein
MFRALIRGALKAQADRGTALAALRAAGGWNHALREEQRQRDQTTVRYFAAHVSKELGIGEPEATLAVAILLGAIETVLAQWRRRPTPRHATQLENAYITLVTGGLAQLATISARSAARLTDPSEDLTVRSRSGSCSETSNRIRGRETGSNDRRKFPQSPLPGQPPR